MDIKKQIRSNNQTILSEKENMRGSEIEYAGVQLHKHSYAYLKRLFGRSFLLHSVRISTRSVLFCHINWSVSIE